MIDQIKNKHLRQKRIQKEQYEEQKLKEIYELKMKLMHKLQKQKTIKQKMKEEAIMETELLKKQIAEREEQRKLLALIEKEQ